MSFDYSDPILFKKRDSYVPLTETHQVINGKIQLQEVPDEFQKVTITTSGTWIETKDKIDTTEKYKVNYSTGIVTLDSSHNGSSLDFSYYGTGAILIPSTRVWTKEENGDATETMREVIDTTNQAKDDANSAAESANTQAENAKTQATHAKTQGDYAKQIGDENKTTWKNPVATYTDIATTYTSPVHGDTVQVTDTGKIYRYIADNWVQIQEYNNTIVTDIQNKLSLQDQQTQTLVHGLNVINSDQASDVKVEFHSEHRVNLLGKGGDCEELTDLNPLGDTTIELDSTNYTQGNNSIKITMATSGNTINSGEGFPVKTGKYYLIAYDLKKTSGTVRHAVYDTANGAFVNSYETVNIGSSFGLYYQKFAPTQDSDIVKLYFNALDDNTVFNVDAIRLYEVSQSVNDKINDLSLTGDDVEYVEREFPYVDSIKGVKNPVLSVSGSNLFDGELVVGNIQSNGTLDSTSDYVRSKNKTFVVEGNYYTVKGFENGVNSSGGNTSDVVVAYYDENNNLLSRIVSTTGITQAPTNASYLYFKYSDVNENLTNNIMLNLGDTALPYTDYNPSYLYAETTLYGNDVKKDILFRNFDLNRWEVKRDFKGRALTGDDVWKFNVDGSGFKRVYITLPNSGVHNSEKVVKYDGEVLQSVVEVGGTWDGDLTQLASDGTSLIVAISDTDSGWLQYEKPRADDQKGYFYGWQVNGHTAGTDILDEATGQLADTGTYNLVNTGNMRNVVVEMSDDNSTWASATEGTDYTLSWDGTTMTLTNTTGVAKYFRVDYNYGYVANSWQNIVDGSAPSTNTLAYVSSNQAPSYENYFLLYQLASPTVEEVSVEGDLSIEGDAQISVTSGFSYTTDPDTGKRTYTLTSENERYAETCNLTEVIAKFNNSLKSTVSSMVGKQSDHGTQISIHTNQLIDILVRLKAGGL